MQSELCGSNEKVEVNINISKITRGLQYFPTQQDLKVFYGSGPQPFKHNAPIPLSVNKTPRLHGILILFFFWGGGACNAISISICELNLTCKI